MRPGGHDRGGNAGDVCEDRPVGEEVLEVDWREGPGGSVESLVGMRPLIYVYCALDGKVCALQMRFCAEM